MRLDTVPIHEVELNFNSRDRMTPILRALQYVYCDGQLAEKILALIAEDVSGDKRTNTGRKGMDYWHICVLAAARLGCDLTYDQLQDLAENHRNLQAIMGVGECDETEFHSKTIRNNICLLKPETLEEINRLIVSAGHSLQPDAIENVRADSFVIRTCIHHPTESSLLYDGLRKIILMCVLLAGKHGVTGWRQYEHLLKKVKKLNRKINRLASRKGSKYKEKMKPLYKELLQKSALLTQRARDLCMVIGQPLPQPTDMFGADTLQAFIVRTERVADTATRRVINGETVPNCDKLFSIFEPHTQLYRRGKASEPLQFGRQVLVFEDSAGFIVRSSLMKRDEVDSQVAVLETKALQKDFNNEVNRLSFDRGFHSPENQTSLSEVVEHLCLPKPGAKQSVVQQREADEEFRAAQQNHPGVESAIGALQRGNAMKECRDHSEVGLARYIQLSVLGRNLLTLGRILIRQEHEDAPAGRSRRKAA